MDLNTCTLAQVPAHRAARVCSLLFGLLVLGCDRPSADSSSVRAEALQGAASEVTQAHAFFSEPSLLREAESALDRTLPEPILALELVIRPDRVVLQASDPAHPKDVVQYEYRAGRVHGPVRVKLFGPGELEDNLFPLAEADLSSVPAFVQKALEKVGTGGRVSHVVLRRNLPHTLDVRFRAHFAGPQDQKAVQADARGRWVGPS